MKTEEYTRLGSSIINTSVNNETSSVDQHEAMQMVLTIMNTVYTQSTGTNLNPSSRKRLTLHSGKSSV